MKQYPEKFDWVFEYDGTPYKLKCKEKMFWDTYKLRLADVEILDKDLSKDDTKTLKQIIVNSINAEMQ